METISFDFNRINNIYIAARQNDRQTLVFEVRNGRGIFVFMMFFSETDDSKDQLFLYLARTSRMLRIKMYGRHSLRSPEENAYTIYLTGQHQTYIREELGIQGGTDNPFDIQRFLEELNASIPQQLNLAELQEHCREHRAAFSHPELRRAIDDADKIYLIGPRQLAANQKPREQTLRKLYLHVDADADVLERFINELKRLNKTVAWTDNPRQANNDLRTMLNQL
ncbi:TPA: hypothetical protein ACGJWA_005296 [Pseudomonas aeruginosa]|uniref:hypothetical protein n=1 Tax=Pseudomonas TaxID=286 RepID=UPI00068DFBFD|nr:MULTISPECIES: hypothetical protein [Pseudomonas]AWQ82995.1 hypothetical protein CSC33_2733 [Pseudomonas aeruginosa]MBG4272030.1 hypothetical protein [Pseudomonas aeruginosa]MBG4399131.1 hypothetical protein [Pseudomonas aeruginosa]MBN7869047.1 hypothetical protein [Pseudomonas aeruginosa]MCT2411307.1 hypothetical protein [Pseudomonas aeruginosa]